MEEKGFNYHVMKLWIRRNFNKLETCRGNKPCDSNVPRKL